LLFNFLDELLFGFATDFFVAKQLRITTFDRDSWRVVAEGCASLLRHALQHCYPNLLFLGWLSNSLLICTLLWRACLASA
jgi:hypothetical protein